METAVIRSRLLPPCSPYRSFSCSLSCVIPLVRHIYSYKLGLLWWFLLIFLLISVYICRTYTIFLYSCYRKPPLNLYRQRGINKQWKPLLNHFYSRLGKRFDCTLIAGLSQGWRCVSSLSAMLLIQRHSRSPRTLIWLFRQRGPPGGFN